MHLFEGVTGTEEPHEALRKDGFQSLFVAQSEAREFFFFFCELTRLFFCAACWTMASGMRLANHVKSQCGEIRKFDWCCEILSEAGAPCGSRFQSKRAFRCHQLRSNLHGHGRQRSVFSSVIINYCPWCRSTFSVSIDASSAEGTTPALEDALMADDAKKGRLTRRKPGTPSKETEAGARGDAISRAGSKKKPAAFCKSTTQPMGIINKQCLRTEQATMSLCGAIFDTTIMATENDVVKSMREQTRRYNEKSRRARATRWVRLRSSHGED